MSDPADPAAISPLDRRLLLELEPEAGRLLDRHLGVAQEWFPHDYIPYRLGRDFDTEPWTPDQPRLTGVAQTSFEVNLLTEDAASLMAEIRAPRTPSVVFTGWRNRIETEARLEQPEVYEAVEKRLLLSATCDPTECRAQLGVLTFGGPPQGPPQAFTLDFQAPEQNPTERDARFGQRSITLAPGDWSESNPADSTLVQDVSVAARRAILGGDVEGLRLFSATFILERPVATRERGFRLVASGLEGRHSVGTLLALPAPSAQSAAPSAAPSAPAGAAVGPETAFGELHAREWADRFATSRGAVSAAESRVADAASRAQKGEPGADQIKVLESSQLETLKGRLRQLTADADRWHVPEEYRH